MDTTVYTSVAIARSANIESVCRHYASEETESKMNILVKDGKLFVEQKKIKNY
jgi:acetolactate synthase small subunit